MSRVELVIKPQGSLVADSQRRASVNKWKFQDSMMGEQYITFNITSEKPIEWAVGDYCVFRGEVYTLNYIPSVTQKARTNERQDSYTYDNVKFDSRQEELIRCQMLDITPTNESYDDTQGTNYTGSSVFRLYCGETTVGGVTRTAVCTLADKMQANLDRFYGAGVWTVQVDPDHTHTEDKELSFNNQTVAQALAEVNNTFELNYSVRGRVISIGYTLKNVTSDDDSDTFAFGYGKGYPTASAPGTALTQIKKISNSQQQIVTRLRVLGSTKNLPYRYYNKKYGLSQTLFPTNLQLPDTFLPLGSPSDPASATGTTKWSRNKYRRSVSGTEDLRYVLGATNDAYIDKDDNAPASAEGIREYTVVFDGSNDNEEIFPTIENATYRELRGAAVADMEGNTSGDTSTYFAGYEQDECVDELLAIGKYVDGILVDDANIGGGINPESGKITVDSYNASLNLTSLGYAPNTGGSFTPEDDYYIGPGRTLFTVPSVAPGSYAMAPTTDSVIYSFNLGATGTAYAGYVIKIVKIISGVETVIGTYKSGFTQITNRVVSEVELPALPDAESASPQIASITVDHLCDIAVMFYPTLKNVVTTEPIAFTYQVGKSRLPGGTDYIPRYNWIDTVNGVAISDTFHVFIKDMGFNIADCFNGQTAVLAAKSGNCVGREFEIGSSVADVTYGGVRGRMLTLKRAVDNGLNTYYPSAVSPISAGDKFVLLNIDMPDAYVKMAEMRLLDAATQWLDENSETSFIYQPSIDDIYLQRNYDNMLAAGTPEESVFWRLYAGLKFSFNGIPSSAGGSLPSSESTIEKITITMGDNMTPKVELTLNDDIQSSILQKVVENVGKISDEVGSIKTVIRGGTGEYLSKTNDDTAAGNITFKKEISVEGSKVRFGKDGEIGSLEVVNVGSVASPEYALKSSLPFYSDSWVASGGINGSGSGGGSGVNLLAQWSQTIEEPCALSATLGVELHDDLSAVSTRVSAIEGNYVTLNTAQALTNKTYNGYTLADAAAKGVVTTISNASGVNLPTEGAVVNYVTSRMANVPTDEELGVTNNAVAENRARITDIEAWMHNPNAASAYIKELSADAINLAGVDIWYNGTQVEVGGIVKASSFVGNLTGNVTGDVTGNLHGNADTASKWATARVFKITDGTHNGTDTSVDGSTGPYVLNLPTSLTLTGTLNVQGASTLGVLTAGATTLASLTVNGTSTFNNNMTLTSGKYFYLGAKGGTNYYFWFDYENGAIKTNANFYADGWVASGGIGTDGGSSVIDGVLTLNQVRALTTEDLTQVPSAYAMKEVDARVTTVESSLGNYVLSSTLFDNGVIRSSLLPSYVDDVLEYASMSAFPTTGESGKIYVAKDTNLTYRWGGSTYVEISPSLALGETASTAYRGDRGKIAYDHSQLTSGNPHGTTIALLADTQLSNPTNGQTLVYNGTSWVNADISDTFPLNNAIAENRSRIIDLEAWKSNPTMSEAYIKELGADAINLGGNDIWYNGTQVEVGAHLKATSFVGNASSATKWANPVSVQIQDSYGEHTGTATSIDGSSSTAIFKLPSAVKFAAATIATVLSAATLNVSGATTLGGTLGVTGATTLSNTLTVTGATTLNSSLGVTGASTFGGNVFVNSDKRIYFGNNSGNNAPYIEYDFTNNALHTNIAFYADSWVASGGIGSAGGGSIVESVLGYSDVIALSSEDLTVVPSAYALKQTIDSVTSVSSRVTALENGIATTVKIGTNAYTAVNNVVSIPYTTGTSTLAWGSEVTLASFGGYSIKATLPADPHYTLPLASNGTRGGIQIGYSDSNANIGVKLSSEKAYVTLTSTSVTSALGYTPFNNANFTANNIANTLGNTYVGNATHATNADVATKLGTSTVGSATQPIYLNAGVPTAIQYTLGTASAKNVGSIADGSADLVTGGNIYSYLLSEIAVNNAIAENRARISDIENWFSSPTLSSLYVSELSTLGINLGGIDLWNDTNKVYIGSGLGVDGTLTVSGAATFGSSVTMSKGNKLYLGTHDNTAYYFELDNNGYIHTNANFYADGFVASGGIGTAGGGSEVNLLTSWSQTYDSTYALGAALGVELHNNLTSLSATVAGNYTSLNSRVTALEVYGSGVVSVGISVPNGLSVSGSPVTSSGVIAIALASGRIIPTEENVNKGVTAYGWGDHSIVGYALSTEVGVTNNAIAELYRRVADVEAWKAAPVISEAIIGELNVSGGINLSGVDIWYNDAQIEFGGSVKASSFVGNASTATTATNLANTPTWSTEGNTFKLTVGGKTTAAYTAPFATKAAQDANGNAIISTYATKTQLTDGSVTKVGTATVGSTYVPIYLNAGVPTQVSLGTIASSNAGLVTGGTVYTYLTNFVTNDELGATNNAVAELNVRLGDVEAWKANPVMSEATIGELGVLGGINLGGTDLWYNGSQVEIGGATKIDGTLSVTGVTTLNNVLKLNGSSTGTKRIYFGNDAYLELDGSGYLHASVGFYSDSWVASGGIGSQGGGSSVNLLTAWSQTYDSTYALGAALGVELHNDLSSLTSRVVSLENGVATTIYVGSNSYTATSNVVQIPFSTGTTQLAWNTEITIATIGGNAIKAKLPTQPTYTLPLAASGTRGGIQIGFSGSGANIPVKLSSEKAYVTVTDTSITSALGYTPYNAANIGSASVNYASSAGSATSATNDSSGNSIVGTYSTNVELGSANNAIAQLRSDVNDIMAWKSKPNASEITVGELSISGGINLSGVDVWYNGTQVEIGSAAKINGNATLSSSLRVGTYVGINIDPSQSYRLYVNGATRLDGTTYLGGPTYYLGNGAAGSYLYSLGIGGTNTSYKLYVYGTSYLDGATTVNSTLSVGNTISLTGSTKRIYFGNDAYLELLNGYLHASVGFYSDDFVASGGIGSAGGSGGSSLNVNSYSQIQEGIAAGVASEDSEYVPTSYALRQVYDKASEALTKSNGIISGSTTLSSATINGGGGNIFLGGVSNNANIIFYGGSTERVALSSADNALVIKPSSSSATGQILLTAGTSPAIKMGGNDIVTKGVSKMTYGDADIATELTGSAISASQAISAPSGSIVSGGSHLVNGGTAYTYILNNAKRKAYKEYTYAEMEAVGGSVDSWVRIGTINLYSEGLDIKIVTNYGDNKGDTPSCSVWYNISQGPYADSYYDGTGTTPTLMGKSGYTITQLGGTSKYILGIRVVYPLNRASGGITAYLEIKVAGGVSNMLYIEASWTRSDASFTFASSLSSGSIPQNWYEKTLYTANGLSSTAGYDCTWLFALSQGSTIPQGSGQEFDMNMFIRTISSGTPQMWVKRDSYSDTSSQNGKTVTMNGITPMRIQVHVGQRGDYGILLYYIYSNQNGEIAIRFIQICYVAATSSVSAHWEINAKYTKTL